MAGELLLEIGVALTAIALAGTVAARVGLSVILAYIRSAYSWVEESCRSRDWSAVLTRQ